MSVGREMLKQDSPVVLTHFKGYAMGGFGGSLKNIAIGMADGPVGKKMVHAAPDNEDYASWLTGEPFRENRVESAKASIDLVYGHPEAELHDLKHRIESPEGLRLSISATAPRPAPSRSLARPGGRSR